MPQKELYITVIGEYKLSDGGAIFSEPSTLSLSNRPKSEIFYHLEWGKSGLFNKKIQAKNCKLIIESDAKETPKLFLACRKDGRMNIELNDTATQILITVGEYQTGWKDVSPGTVVKLLASADDEKYFELKATKPESLTVPKK